MASTLGATSVGSYSDDSDDDETASRADALSRADTDVFRRASLQVCLQLSQHKQP